MIMELKTQDGFTLISNEELQACHDLAKLIPDLIKTVVINYKAVNIDMTELMIKKNKLAKLRQLLEKTDETLKVFKTERIIKQHVFGER